MSFITSQLAKYGILLSRERMEVAGHIEAKGGLSIGLGRGRVYYVDPANGSDTYDGRTPRRALATIAAAEDKCVANRNDTVVYIGGSTSASLTESLTWDKNYTHLVGICAPTNVSQRARIFNSGAVTPLITISATGCIFKNLAIKQEYSHATAGCVTVTGGRNYFENVHFAGQIGSLAQAGASAYSLKLDGAEENLFVGCTIGVDTVVLTNGKPLWLDGSAVRNEFDDCFFSIACETDTKAIVRFQDTTAVDRTLIFKRCLFYNFWTNHGGKLNEVFTIPASMATCDIVLQDCIAVGFTQWAENDRGNIWVSGSAPATGTAGVGSSGIVVEPS